MTARQKLKLTPKPSPERQPPAPPGKLAARQVPRDEREQSVEESRQRQERSEACLQRKGDQGGKVC